MALFWYSFLFLFVINGAYSKDSCQINVQTLTFKPFILKNNGDLWPAENDMVEMKNAENATVTCQQYNFEKYPKETSIRIKCENGKLATDTGKALTIQDMKCDLKIIDIFKCDVKDCTEDSVGACFAYYDKLKNSNVKVAEICYNTNSKRTRFVRMHIAKKLGSIGMSVNRKELTDFYDKIDIIKNMIKFDYDKLHELLDYDRPIKSNDDLGIRKIIPENFFNDQLKDVQKYPINNVGVWPLIYDGNWNSIIRDLKNHLMTKDDDMVVTFGTKGTLMSHSDKIVYSKGKFEMIPQYLWVSLRKDDADDGVVVVVLNDPYASVEELKSKMFCKNICANVPWLKIVMKNNNNQRPALGYTFCCSLKDFKN